MSSSTMCIQVSECSICLRTLHSPDRFSVSNGSQSKQNREDFQPLQYLRCSQVSHIDCITRRITVHHICPICRSRVNLPSLSSQKVRSTSEEGRTSINEILRSLAAKDDTSRIQPLVERLTDVDNLPNTTGKIDRHSVRRRWLAVFRKRR